MVDIVRQCFLGMVLTKKYYKTKNSKPRFIFKCSPKDTTILHFIDEYYVVLKCETINHQLDFFFVLRFNWLYYAFNCHTLQSIQELIEGMTST